MQIRFPHWKSQIEISQLTVRNCTRDYHGLRLKLKWEHDIGDNVNRNGKVLY